MAFRHKHFTWAGAFAVAACGAATSSPTPTTAELTVGGTYPTEVSLVAGKNTCGAVTIQANPTVITHTSGASTFSLVHTSIVTTGSVKRDGSFTTDLTTLVIGSTSYKIGITGQFLTNGLTAVVHLDVTQPGPPATCSYEVQWTATKQGAASVIPG